MHFSAINPRVVISLDTMLYYVWTLLCVDFAAWAAGLARTMNLKALFALGIAAADGHCGKDVAVHPFYPPASGEISEPAQGAVADVNRNASRSSTGAYGNAETGDASRSTDPYDASASSGPFDPNAPLGNQYGGYDRNTSPNPYDLSVPSGYRYGAYGAGAPPSSYDTSVSSGYRYGAYGAGAPPSSYDTSVPSGYRYGAYAAGAPPNSYDTSVPSGYRYGAYGAGAPPNPYASAISEHGYEHSEAGASYGADARSQRNPYDLFPTRNAYAPSSDLYGEDPTSSLERGNDVVDRNIYDPLGAPRSGQSGDVDSVTEPYGLSPYAEPKPKSPEPKGDAGILGFNPFDPNSILAPTHPSTAPR